MFGAPAATEADQQLKHCTERLEDYTERVFTALRPELTSAPAAADQQAEAESVSG